MNNILLFESLVFFSEAKDHNEQYNKKKRNQIVNLLEYDLLESNIESPIKVILLGSYIWVLSDDYKILTKVIENIKNKLVDILQPINLTEKSFMAYLFNCNFSDNLIECCLEGEIDDYDYFENNILYGSNINNSYEYLKIMELDNISFSYVKIQKMDRNEVITLGRQNNLKFGKNMSEEQITKTLIDLTKLHENYLKGMDS